MTVYADELHNYPAAMMDARTLRNGTWWGHLYTDSDDLTELHAIAKKVGMRREWFQDRKGFPHYDLVPRRRLAALAAGATPMPLREFLTKRKGEVKG